VCVCVCLCVCVWGGERERGSGVPWHKQRFDSSTNIFKYLIKMIN
jgi:hypothetical protein